MLVAVGKRIRNCILAIIIVLLPSLARLDTAPTIARSNHKVRIASHRFDIMLSTGTGTRDLSNPK